MQKEIFKQVASILLICGLAQFTMENYLPALPSLSAYFSVNPSTVQLTLGVFMLLMGCSQLIYGPLSDHYGRRPTLALGLVLLLFGTAICYFAHSIVIFFTGRALQGLGAGATSNLTKSIARDIDHNYPLKKLSSYIMAVWSLALLVSPIIGSIILHYSNWREIFLFTFFFEATLLAYVCFCFKETHLKKQKASTAIFFQRVRNIVKNRQFSYNVFACCLIIGILTSFSIEAPFYLQLQLHYSVLAYGLLITIIACGYVLGSLLNARFSRSVTQKILNECALICAAISASIMLITSTMMPLNVYILLVPMFFISICVAIVVSNVLSACMAPFPNFAGTASSIYGGIVFCSGFLMNYIVSTFVRQRFSFFSIFVFSLVMLISATFYLFYKSLPADTESAAC